MIARLVISLFKLSDWHKNHDGVKTCCNAGLCVAISKKKSAKKHLFLFAF